MESKVNEVNENEVVEFHNGSDHDLNMVWGGRLYTVCKAHQTVSVVRFVAEYWAKRNKNYQLVEDSDRARNIEKYKAEVSGTEITELQRRDEEAEAKKAQEEREAESLARKLERKKKKKEVEEDIEDEDEKE